jgi:hypothetical protein
MAPFEEAVQPLADFGTTADFLLFEMPGDEVLPVFRARVRHARERQAISNTHLPKITTRPGLVHASRPCRGCRRTQR